MDGHRSLLEMTLVPQTGKWERVRSTAWLVGLAAIAMLFRFDFLPADAAAILHDVRSEGKNRIDQGRMIQGYYQDLNQAETQGGGGWAEQLGDALVAGRVAPRGVERFSDSGATRKSETGYLSYELIPGIEVEHLGVTIKVNRWGQRDRDYELSKPPGTFRIALVGASNSMGWGVRVEEAFPELVEERLNRELAGQYYKRYELINFSVPGYSVVEQLYVVEEIVPRFSPDLILMETCAEEIQWNLADRTATRFHRGMELRFDFLEKIVADAGLSRSDKPSRMKRRLMPAAQAIVRNVYQYLGALGRNLQTPVALVILRLEVSPRIHPLLDWSAAAAEEYGIIPLRVYQAFAANDRPSMYLANEKDHHPSAKAHALLADDLFEQLMTEPRIRFLLLPAAAEGKPGT